jgi:uncharacterized protein (UPF0276 family)
MQDRPARPGLGIGLRQPHIAEVVARRPSDVWFEVHAENFMFDEDAAVALDRVRDYASLSLHGVALSLGSTGDLDAEHLKRLKRLVERYDPFLISEHLAWCAIDGAYLNDLLPLPYTEESLDLMVLHVNQVQTVLGRRILIENPSRYLSFRHSTIEESAFLTELSDRSGCGLLCDLNNIYVSAANLELNAEHYLASLPAHAVAEVHLAGHSARETASGTVLIDDHGSEVSLPVWSLYRRALEHFGPLPTLIEWDNDLPSLYVLLKEAGKGRALLEHWEAARASSVPEPRDRVLQAS